MRRLHQAGQFGGRDQGHIARTPPPHNNNFLLFRDLIQDRSELVSQMGICSFDSQGALNPIVQGSCTLHPYWQPVTFPSTLPEVLPLRVLLPLQVMLPPFCAFSP